MSLSRRLLQPLPAKSAVFRYFSTEESRSPGRNYHKFLPPTNYIGSWQPSHNPKEAAARLAFLRRDYERRVKIMRKEFIVEVEAQRIDKSRKDEARKEALRIANEERRAAKDAKKKAEAIERQAAEKEFRETLMKEKAEKLDYWTVREKKVEERKKQKAELLHRQSSLWVDEAELEKKIFEAVVDETRLDYFRVQN